MLEFELSPHCPPSMKGNMMSDSNRNGVAMKKVFSWLSYDSNDYDANDLHRRTEESDMAALIFVVRAIGPKQGKIVKEYNRFSVASDCELVGIHPQTLLNSLRALCHGRKIRAYAVGEDGAIFEYI